MPCPGKQMSIDSDLSSGLIDETEARRRRKQLAAEAEFYGAMDGASRFTQRDAVASILITGINIVAGFLIGVLQHGMELRHALETYTVLTIGDGLVTVVPALMISVSGGLIITRPGSDARLGADFRKQVFGSPQPLLLASGVLIVLACLPGMPAIPFLLLGVGLGTVGWRMRSRPAAKEQAPSAAKPARENLEGLLKRRAAGDRSRAGTGQDGGRRPELPAAARISGIRRQLATELGYLLPPVRVADNSSAARARIRSLSEGRGDRPLRVAAGLPAGHSLRAQELRPPEGTPTREPAFGLAAWWIPDQRAEQARAAGYTLVDSVSVLGTHIAELARRHAHELFSRQDAKKVLDLVAVEQPKVVEDLVPKQLPLSVVQRVLQNLLRERVSIRDTGSILEALGEAALSTRNLVLLTEYARQAIRRTVVKRYLDASGNLPAYFPGRLYRTGRGVRGAARRAEQSFEHGAADHTGDSGSCAAQGRRPGGTGGSGDHLRRPLFSAANRRAFSGQSVLCVAQRDSGRRESGFSRRDPVEEKYANQIVLCEHGGRGSGPGPPGYGSGGHAGGVPQSPDRGAPPGGV